MTDLCWLVAQVVAERCPIHRNAPIDQPWEIAATPFKAVETDPVAPSPPIAAATIPPQPWFSGDSWRLEVKEREVLVASAAVEPTAVALKQSPAAERPQAASTPAAPVPLAPSPRFSSPGLCGAATADCAALFAPLPSPRSEQATNAGPWVNPRSPLGPRSGPELYRQRQLAVYSGRLYTRIAPDAYRDRWAGTTRQPTYSQWRTLLGQEAAAVAAGQGPNRLEVVLGDSIGLWLPTESLPGDRLWLNQGISGDTTAGVLARLDGLAQTRPTVVHLMVGVNDLKTNVPEAQIVRNLERIVAQLQRQHPQARLVLYSVLPTRRDDISSERVRSLNNHIAYLAAQRHVAYRDLQGLFRDEMGSLRVDLTTDGIHLNRQGYALWQQVMLAVL
jgi:lysophospholipase L1-like esterase